MEPPATLADLRRGHAGTIAEPRTPDSDSGSEIDARVRRRLHDLGFTPGRTVEVVRVAPLGDPIIVRVAGYELALRRAEARRIPLTPAYAPQTPGAPGAPATSAAAIARDAR